MKKTNKYNIFKTAIIVIWIFVWILGIIKMISGNFFEGFVIMTLSLIVLKLEGTEQRW